MKSAYSQATPLRKENVFGPSVIGHYLVALLLTAFRRRRQCRPVGAPVGGWMMGLPRPEPYATSLQQLSSVIIGEFSELELAAFKTH